MISENPTTEELQRRIRALEREVADYKARLADQRTSEMKQRRYGLVWEDVPEAFDAEAENSIPILEEDPSLSVLQNDGQPTHLLIEGDNYHALTCLNYTHRGRIDVIYIDPPYNTGSDGFTYRDRRFLTEFPNGQKIDTTHPLRHSAWLSFMEKRLRLAKELLSQRGVIFISIGNDELNHLISLCDQLLGSTNQIGIISRLQKKGSDKGDFFSPSIDYVLAYARKKECLSPFFEAVDTSIFKHKEQDGDRKGELYECSKSLYQSSLDSRPNQRYWIECPDGSFVIPPGNLYPNEICDASFITPASNDDKCWRWSYDSYKEKKHLLVFKKTKSSPLINENLEASSWNVYTKRYLSDAQEKGNVPSNFIEDCPNSLGTKRVKELQIKFAYTKPVELVKKLIEITDKPKDITVLDFFAGSGTTCDAVAQLNADDGGHRQCILVQQQEDTKICETVTRERCRKVLTGYRSSKGEDVKGLGGSLRYYRTAFVGKHRATQAGDEDAVALSLKAGCLLAIAENTLCETKHTDAYQLYTDHAGRTTAIYFRESVEEFDDFLADIRKTEGHVVAYVFSWGDASEFEDDFLDFDGRVELKAIPKPILDIYKALA